MRIGLVMAGAVRCIDRVDHTLCRARAGQLSGQDDHDDRAVSRPAAWPTRLRARLPKRSPAS